MNHKVMIAHGESAFRLMASKFLKAKGFDVITAINGLDALQKLENNPVEVIVADQDMPMLDGLGMVAKLADLPNWGKCHVILTLREDMPKGSVSESELIHVLHKPCSLEKMHSRLSQLFDEKTSTTIHDPTPAEEKILTSDDSIYLEMMKDMLEENSCLNRIIRFIHTTEQISSLEEMGKEFYQGVYDTLETHVRLWILQDKQAIVLAPNPAMVAIDQGSEEYRRIEKAFVIKESHIAISTYNYFYGGGILMEVVEYPKSNKHIFQLLSFFLKNFVTIFNSFRDRAYFARIKEQFTFGQQLKHMIVENLNNVRVSSSEYAGSIGASMDSIIDLVYQLQGDQDTILEIDNIAMDAINRLQFTDINNQKLHSIIANLESLFSEMQKGLDTKDEYFFTTKKVNLEHVASASILDKNWQTGQTDVDDLLSSMGL